MERNRLLGLIVGAVAVLSLAVVVVSALGGEDPQLDRDTPEGVVQAYVTAIAEENWADAHALFTPELAERCRVSDLSLDRRDNISRVSIDDVQVTDSTAVVDVVVTYSEVGDPLTTSSWDEDVTFVLVDEGGWVFDEVTWPYFPCRWDEP